MRSASLAALVLIPLAVLAGCGGSSSLTIESETATLSPTVQTAVYRYLDANTADVYLADIPEGALPDRLAAGVDGEPCTIVHLHIFLSPKAGRTPIDYTASNAAVTVCILTGSAVGVYGGGGFMLPSSRLGDASLSGRMRQATVRLVDSGPGFADALGLAEIGGDIAARRDDELASRISAELTRLLLE